MVAGRVSELGFLLLFALVLSLSLFASPARSQSCIPWDGVPSGCAAFLNLSVGDMVYQPAGVDLRKLENDATYIIGALLFSLQEPCLSAALGLICMSHLHKCAVVDGNVTALPINTCWQNCWNFKVFCDAVQVNRMPKPVLGVWAPSDTGLLTCNETDPAYNNGSFYPLTHNTMGNLTIPCVDPPDQPELNFACNPPMQRKGVRCGWVCPVPAYTESQYDGAKVMQNIVAWFSWAASSALFTSLVLYAPSRSFPKVLIVFITVAANIAAGAMILPTFAGYGETWCGGDKVFVEDPEWHVEILASSDIVFINKFWVDFVYVQLLTYSSLCSFQGAMLLFGYLSSTFWWAMIAFNMVAELFFGTFFHKREKLWTWIRLGVYNVIGWALPFLLMVIPTSAGRVGFGPGDTYCFVTQEDDFAWILVFFFIPVGISLLIGVTFFLVAIAKIIWTAIRLRKPALMLQYFRLLLFIFIFLFIYTFVFSYVITIAANNQEIIDGYGTYFACLLDPYFPPYTGTCSLSEDVSNYNLAMLRGFAVSVLGFLLFITFMSWELLKNWANLAKGVYRSVRRQKLTPFLSALRSGSAVSSTSLTNIATMTTTSPSAIDLDAEEGEETTGEEEDDLAKAGSSEEEENSDPSSSSDQQSD